MTTDQFRRLALAMTGASEGAHMKHPDFRTNGRIFATLAPDGKRGMVSLTPEQQGEFLRAHPAMFEPAAGAWGRSGSTMVILAAADEDTIGEAMTLAWKRAADLANRKPGAASRQSKIAGRSSKRKR